MPQIPDNLQSSTSFTKKVYSLALETTARSLDLELLLEPLRGRRNSLVDLLRLLALTLSRGLLATRLTAYDLRDDGGPFVGLDVLCKRL
jgi:hypothetical protein